MAKKRRKKQYDDNVPSLSMTPMIDIVFQLLIFFMLGCKMKTDEGKLKAYLPKDRGQGTVGNPEIDLGELRVKLLWADQSGRPFELRKVTMSFEVYYDQVKNGKVLLKVGEQIFPPINKEWPDYKRLYEHIVAAKADYKAPRSNLTKKMPLIIDAREPVPWKHVVAVLNAAMKAGVDDITFAAPEVPY